MEATALCRLPQDVRDTALMMTVIAGYDPNDPTTSKRPVPDYTASLIGDIEAWRVGIPQPYFFVELQPSVRDAVLQTMDQLAQLGGHLEEQTLTTLDEAPEVLWTLISGDAGVVHEAHLAAHADRLYPALRHESGRAAHWVADYRQAL